MVDHDTIDFKRGVVVYLCKDLALIFVQLIQLVFLLRLGHVPRWARWPTASPAKIGTRMTARMAWLIVVRWSPLLCHLVMLLHGTMVHRMPTWRAERWWPGAHVRSIVLAWVVRWVRGWLVVIWSRLWWHEAWWRRTVARWWVLGVHHVRVVLRGVTRMRWRLLVRM